MTRGLVVIFLVLFFKYRYLEPAFGRMNPVVAVVAAAAVVVARLSAVY